MSGANTLSKEFKRLKTFQSEPKLHDFIDLDQGEIMLKIGIEE
jgi:hypothetical protein